MNYCYTCFHASRELHGMASYSSFASVRTRSGRGTKTWFRNSKIKSLRDIWRKGVHKVIFILHPNKPSANVQASQAGSLGP